MSWLRLDDLFTSHPKFAGWSADQKWAWLELMSYCARYRTGGVIPDDLSLLPKTTTKWLLNRAETSGWIDRNPQGQLTIHDWADYQPKDPTGALRQAEWRARRNGRVTEDVTEDVTVWTRARVPVPSLEDQELSKDQRRERQPTKAEVVAAREARQGSGWVDNLNQYTGCRYIRGSHAASPVYDVLGKERPPHGWPHERPTRAEVAAALKARAEA